MDHRFIAVLIKTLLQGTVTSSALIVGLSLLFIVILYLTLRQTFANYQKSRLDFVESIQVIAQEAKRGVIDFFPRKIRILLISRRPKMICWIDWKRISMIFTS